MQIKVTWAFKHLSQNGKACRIVASVYFWGSSQHVAYDDGIWWPNQHDVHQQKWNANEEAEKEPVTPTKTKTSLPDSAFSSVHAFICPPPRLACSGESTSLHSSEVS